jgi:hypothetical protein
MMDEPYWFDVEYPDPDKKAAYLGTIKSWSQRHDRDHKQRGLHVDLTQTGDVTAPLDGT